MPKPFMFGRLSFEPRGERENDNLIGSVAQRGKILCQSALRLVVGKITSNYPSDLRYWTLKYNPLTSSLLRGLTERRGRNLEWLIFTATSGRSGTMSLARIFSAIDGCVSYHEPWPDMHGAELINPSSDDDSYLSFLYRTVKSLNIRRYSHGAKYYFESNHVFLENFYPYVLEDFPGKVKVIHLFRDPLKVANSLYALGHCPGTEVGNQWYFDYRASKNRIKIAGVLETDENFKHAFYKCLWYWYEIEARVKAFREQYSEVTVVDFHTEDMNDKNRIAKMLDELQIPYDLDRIAKVAGVKENLMTAEKKTPPLELEMAAQMQRRFLDLLSERGYCEYLHTVRWSSTEHIETKDAVQRLSDK